MSILFPNEDDAVITKKCVYCKRELSITEYSKHIQHKDRLDSRCKECIKKQSKIRSGLHKIAPPKPKVCECCKQIPIKWCLDHDHKTNKIRGWICDSCNTGLGKLGDTVDGVEKALNYLKTIGD